MADKAWHVNRIMGDLLESARIEAHPLTSSRSTVDLQDVVLKAVDRARPRAELNGAEVVTSLGAEPVHVDADPLQLGRILDNLINNGLTYAARPPRLRVSVTMNTERAVVHVIDNGVGMSEIERARVFRPFHRGNDPAFGSVPGSGLGLYVSRLLAEANKGELTLERTEVGLGTSFALNLPLARLEPA